MTNPCPLKPDKSRIEQLEEKFKDISDSLFDETEKKMDANRIGRVAEQRCRPFGCKLEGCLYSMRDPTKCNKLFRDLNICIDLERKDIIDNFIKTNKQATI